MDFNNLNYLDAALGGIVIISTLISIGRGLVREILSLIAWGLALYLAFRFADPIAQQHLNKFFDSYPISYLLAFGGIFMLALFANGLVDLLVGEIMSAAKLGGIDRLLGMIFGFLRGLIIGAIVTLIATLFGLHHETWWKASKLAPTFENLSEWGVKRLPDDVIRIIQELREPTQSALPHLDTQAGVLPYRADNADTQKGQAQRPTRLRLESTDESQP